MLSFLRELLRSESGQEWYKIFGYSGNIPDKLTIDVCIAAPVGKYGIIKEPAYVSLGQDMLRFKYLTFETDNKNIKSIKTDLFD